MFEFAYTLNLFPEKFQFCKYKKYMKHGYRCAPMDNYIFVYRKQKNDIKVINIIHAKRLNLN